MIQKFMGNVEIETEWNLETTLSILCNPRSIVEIETEWNLEERQSNRIAQPTPVEIETEWNLEEMLTFADLVEVNCRDRNRVEFRGYGTVPYWQGSGTVEIETEWNLEFVSDVKSNISRVVEIETEWNLEIFVTLTFCCIL